MSTPAKTSVRICRPTADDVWVDGYESATPGLVVHRGLFGAGWQVTHAPTGCYVSTPLRASRTRAQTLEWAAYLGTVGIAWTRLRKVPPSRAVVEKFRAAWSTWEDR